MASNSPEQLGNQFVRLKLITQPELLECLDAIGMGATTAELISTLERRQYLTSYQARRARKGETNALVLGKYKLLYRNASGSFARVFRGADVDTGEMVGIKLLRQRYNQEPASIAEFHREAELGKRLKHPNIVPIYDVDESNGYHYFVMEFIEGGNFREFINIRKKLSPEEATRYALHMTRGLEYALGMGFSHRDLKMTNVLLSTAGVAKLVDFGLAGGQLHTHLERGESFARALEYATLEKGTGAPRNDPRSDIFFLGGIYYELLTGVPAFTRTRDREQRSHLSRYSETSPVTAHEPHLPERVVKIVGKMMQLNPAIRYQSPTELVAELGVAMKELTGDVEQIVDADRAVVSPHQNVPSVMCVESRTRQQNSLREYFSKHGYRVLVLGDLQRALNRLASSPPDSVILMAESAGQGAVTAYRDAAAARNGSLVTVLVLPETQAALKEHLQESSTAHVLVQPVTLRDLHDCIRNGLRAKRTDAHAD